MLHIEHEEAPVVIRRDIARIKSSPEWRAVDSQDTRKLRGYFDQLDKDMIRDVLIKRQHGLCAYCMSRISNNHTTRLEHVKALSADKDNALDFNNIVAVCSGGTCVDGDKGRILCCDAAKGDQELTYLSPFLSDVEDFIQYDKNGNIKCNPAYSRCKDVERDISILHLNGARKKKNSDVIEDTYTKLRASRKNTWIAAEKYIKWMADNNMLTIGKLDHEIKKLKDKNPRQAYVGVSIYVYKRKQKQLSFKENRNRK